MKLGDFIRNPLDTRDHGVYQIIIVKRYHMHWMFTAIAADNTCVYASIGGSL